MRQRRAVAGSWMAVPVALIALGCGGSGESGHDGGTGGAVSGQGGTGGAATGGAGAAGFDAGDSPTAQFASAFVSIYCGTLVACGEFADLATCEGTTVFADGTLILTAESGIARGTVAYDPTAAAACLAALPRDCETTQYSASLEGTSGADNLFAVVPSCPQVFTGLLGLNAPCALSVECAPSTPDCGTGFAGCDEAFACCGSTCQANAGWAAHFTPHQPGEDCTDNNLCALPGICVSWNGPAACVTPAPEGGTCTVVGNMLCGRMDDYCNAPTPDGAGTCVRRLPSGSPCSATGAGVDPCPGDEYCAYDASSATSACQQRAGNIGDACSYGTCLSLLTCGPASTCVAHAPSAPCTAPAP